MSRLPLDRNCFVTSITLAALAKLGLGALEMDPLMVRDAVQDVFDMENMPQRMFDKLNCGLTMLGTSLYTEAIEGFLPCTAVMNNQVVSGSTIPYCTIRECAWGIWEYMNLNGDVDAESKPTEQFSPDIIAYIQQAANRNGVSSMPVWMEFAEKDPNFMPDLSEDIDLFESYTARQEAYVNTMNEYVQNRQNELLNELKLLKEAGIIAQKTA